MNRKSLLGVLACLALVVVAIGGCNRLRGVSQPSQSQPTESSVASTPTSNDSVTTYQIPPTATNPGLSGPFDPDFVAVDRAAPSNGELFLFLRERAGSRIVART